MNNLLMLHKDLGLKEDNSSNANTLEDFLKVPHAVPSLEELGEKSTLIKNFLLNK